DALDAQHVEQAGGDLRPKPLVVLEPARVGKLGKLRAQRSSSARNVRRLTASVASGDVLRPSLDGIGHSAVGDGLVDHLAQDLEHIPDLVEDAGELAVADDRFA